MTRTFLILATLADAFIFGVSVYYEEWFFCQLLIVTQMIILIAVLSYHRQQGVEDTDYIRLRGPGLACLVATMVGSPVLLISFDWSNATTWIQSSHLITHRFGDVTILLGVVIAASTVIGSVMLQRGRQ